MFNQSLDDDKIIDISLSFDIIFSFDTLKGKKYNSYINVNIRSSKVYSVNG